MIEEFHRRAAAACSRLMARLPEFSWNPIKRQDWTDLADWLSGQKYLPDARRAELKAKLAALGG